MILEIRQDIVHLLFIQFTADALEDLDGMGITIIDLHMSDTDIAAAPSPAFHNIASLKGKAGGEDIVDLRWHTGKVISFVIPSGGKVLGFLGRGGELVIEWDRIRKIGLDVILVDDAGLTL